MPKQPAHFGRFSTVAGEKGSADTVRDVRGFALKFYTEVEHFGRADPAYGEGMARGLGLS